MTIRKLVRMASSRPAPSMDAASGSIAAQILSGELSGPSMGPITNAVAKKLLGEA